MSPKTAIWIGMFVGSIVGGYIPVLFGASIFSMWSLFGNTIGALLGVFIGYKLTIG